LRDPGIKTTDKMENDCYDSLPWAEHIAAFNKVERKKGISIGQEEIGDKHWAGRNRG
jgi:hypothetical protein